MKKTKPASPKLSLTLPKPAGQRARPGERHPARDRELPEESPIGLILCAAADAEQVELFQLDAKSIRVSEYLLEHTTDNGKTYQNFIIWMPQ